MLTYSFQEYKKYKVFQLVDNHKSDPSLIIFKEGLTAMQSHS